MTTNNSDMKKIMGEVSFLLADCDRRMESNAEMINDAKESEEFVGRMTSIFGNGKSGRAREMASARVKHLERGNLLVKLEKLIYQAIQKGNFALLPVLRTKYMDEMTTTLDSSGNLVEMGVMKENQYLFFADGAKKQSEYISLICNPSVYGN